MRIHLLIGFALLTFAAPSPGQNTHQATGLKIAEVTADSAIIWVRRTAAATRRTGTTLPSGDRLQPLPSDVKTDDFPGECPGAPGRVRLLYTAGTDLQKARTTDWSDVTAATDFARQFRITGLKPATLYRVVSETAPPGGTVADGVLRARFKTAPDPGQPAAATFTVVTGQMYRDLDNPDGFNIYSAMAALNPDFHVLTGDTVYYDNEEPVAHTVPLARYHWHRMYSLPRLVAFHLQVPAFWIKDDHDTLYNDCWPGMKSEAMLPLTFADGQRIFLEQVPMGEKTWRTCRWGSRLQIWLPEGRDFRSPNTMPDGPNKTIWGAAQKEWLKSSISASGAVWKIIISPTPIVGPDRSAKADNHANTGFAHEGNEIRDWIARYNRERNNLFVVCGDRHWQYHSVDPRTGVQEFSCGPASDKHAGGSPGRNPQYHRFHRVQGGFLSVTVGGGDADRSLTFRLHDVEGHSLYAYTAGAEKP